MIRLGPGSDPSIDPDIERITDYLACELSPEELLAVDDRLHADPVFRGKAIPLIKAWNMPRLFAHRFPPPAAVPALTPRQRAWSVAVIIISLFGIVFAISMGGGR